MWPAAALHPEHRHAWRGQWGQASNPLAKAAHAKAKDAHTKPTAPMARNRATAAAAAAAFATAAAAATLRRRFGQPGAARSGGATTAARSSDTLPCLCLTLLCSALLYSIYSTLLYGCMCACMRVCMYCMYACINETNASLHMNFLLVHLCFFLLLETGHDSMRSLSLR